MAKRSKKKAKRTSAGNVDAGKARGPTPNAFGAEHAVLARHRKAAEPVLIGQTEELLSEGVSPQAIIWLITPTNHYAGIAADEIESLRLEVPDLALRLGVFQETLPPGHLSCAYIGPEGLLMEAVVVETFVVPEGHRGIA